MRGKFSFRKKDDRRLSIRTKWILFICTTTFVALIGTVIFMQISIGNVLKKDNLSSNKVTAKSASEQISLNLKGYENSLKQLSGVVSNEINNRDSVIGIDKLLQTVKKNDSTIISAYYMDGKTGKLHISPYADFKQDVHETRTYKTLTKTPKVTWMDVYKDKISGKIMTSVVIPVTINGKMVGALGYDIDLTTIGASRRKIEKYTENNLVILDSQGFVVSAFIENSDGKNMNPEKSGTVEGVSDLISNRENFNSQYDWVSRVYKKDSMPPLDVDLNKKGYNGQVTTIPDLNWKVVSLTPKDIFSSKMNDIKQTGIISIIIGLIIGALCAYYLSGMLKKIILNIQEVLKRTSSGDLTTELSIPSRDELGDLAKSYNEMLAGMRQLIFKVKNNVVSVETTTNGVNTIASENNVAIAEVSQSIEQIAMGASAQSNQIENGLHTIKELSLEIDLLLEQSNMVEKEMQEASTQVRVGEEQVEGLKTSYKNLDLNFKDITRMVSNLNNKSKTIANVTDRISEIAEQTNLLALNASIEAARAGEHGRGFAVVAQEVRRLAEDSKQATKDINEVINSILKENSTLVNMMTETTQTNFEQSQAVKTVSESMTFITESLTKAVDSIVRETESINSINQQKEGVIQIIQEISAVSQQTTASAQEIASIAEEQSASSSELAHHTDQLSKLIVELDDAMKRFQVGRES
ncbi:methyl-accepting chemotaxis protein [Priestia aryabhattai]|uniref:methyl-accepting chemotaxis protein n=1 Tax=Priestia aryabhattai TaxID=412384 RepID=UPI001C0D3AB6|nr:methyl-accepting chemotaxis protein [Priestia aryabhattai]MBU3570057.1 methyl-accepting chemotaxis protein [Priestia aryabhattai]